MNLTAGRAFANTITAPCNPMANTEKPLLYDASGNALSVTPRASTGVGFNLAGLGGIVNPATGLGGPADKTSSAQFYPTVLRTRQQILPFYTESWVARKFIDMPIDDMFYKGRDFTGEDESANKSFQDAWEELKVEKWFCNAMKAGRLYGTGLLALMIDGEMPDLPLMPDKVREGALKSVLAFDRFDFTVTKWQKNLFEMNYGLPDWLDLYSRFGNQVQFHESRLMRFDGIESLSNSGWEYFYDQNWGISELIPAIVEIVQDASFTSAVAHMSQEASLSVVKLQGFQDAITGKPGPKEATPEQMGMAINLYKSIFKTIFLGENDEFSRVGINFSGLSQLFNKFPERVAAMAGIPATRFLSTSPDGENATGESDLRNYDMHVGAMRQKKAIPNLKVVDQVVARHVGLSEVPEHSWRSLLDLSESERYANAQALAEALAAAQGPAGLNENEVRERLSENEVFGVLDPLSEDEMGTRQEMERMLEETRLAEQRSRQGQPPAGE